jgi:hypothetical protein
MIFQKVKSFLFFRHEVGKEFNLQNDETDAIGTELEAAGKIKKVAGIKVVLTPEAKRFLCDG